MGQVISIYEAKTHLSKLIKKARAGEVIYIGAFGEAQAIIAPLPANTKHFKLGIWNHKKKIDYEVLKASATEIEKWMLGENNEATNR